MDKPAQDEWNAWKGIVSTLKEIGVDINEQDALTEAIRFWGWKFYHFQTWQTESKHHDTT